MPAMTDVSEPSARPPASSLNANMAVDNGVRSQQAGLSGPSSGLSPNPGHFNAPNNQYQAVTPAAASHILQQTPVPIPQPPQASMSTQSSVRPGQFQQPQQQSQPSDFAQNFASTVSQPTTPFPQHQVSSTQSSVHYSQQRPQYNASTTGNTPPINIYNPPRPPEVYTLPEHINDALHGQIRENFQHDGAGRVLFFTGPPLDRPHKHFSPQSAGIGHSTRYLAGRDAWLKDREKKRKRRFEAKSDTVGRPMTSFGAAEGIRDTTADEANEALNRWFSALHDRTSEWQQTAGLQGWESHEARGKTKS